MWFIVRSFLRVSLCQWHTKTLETVYESSGLISQGKSLRTDIGHNKQVCGAAAQYFRSKLFWWTLTGVHHTWNAFFARLTINSRQLKNNRFQLSSQSRNLPSSMQINRTSDLPESNLPTNPRTLSRTSKLTSYPLFMLIFSRISGWSRLVER